MALIYSKPTKTLMLEFAKERLAPGRTFRKSDAVAWFAERYPKIKAGTVTMHVDGMSVNAGSLRKHHPTIKPGSGHDLFLKLSRDTYRLWDPKIDPAPVYDDIDQRAAVEVDDTADPGEIEGGREFAFERDLQNYLSRNLERIEPGLRLYEEEGITGLEYPADGRFIDILALDRNNKFVVIELKVSRGYDRVIGQILRYMGWVKANLAMGERVRGVIVASNISEDLKIAASLIPDVSLVEYELALTLRPVASYGRAAATRRSKEGSEPEA